MPLLISVVLLAYDAHEAWREIVESDLPPEVRSLLLRRLNEVLARTGGHVADPADN